MLLQLSCEDVTITIYVHWTMSYIHAWSYNSHVGIYRFMANHMVLYPDQITWNFVQYGACIVTFMCSNYNTSVETHRSVWGYLYNSCINAFNIVTYIKGTYWPWHMLGRADTFCLSVAGGNEYPSRHAHKSYAKWTDISFTVQANAE